MIGSDTGNPVFPVLLPGNQLQYDFNSSTQLQLFGSFPPGCIVDPLSYMGNEHASAVNRPIKRVREAEDTSRQQTHKICLNSNCYSDQTDRSASFVIKPYPVSIGLRLSNDDEGGNSSVTSASGRTTAALPAMLSLGDNLRNEIDRQKEEFDRFIRVQEEHMAKGVQEMKQRHMVSVLSAIEKGVGKQLMEKEIEIQNMNLKNMELIERIKQVATEVQSWHYRAKYNESLVNVLKSNLNKVIAQGAELGKEGCGDSEVEDVASSYVDQNNHVNLGGRVKSISGNNRGLTEQQISCRVCKGNEVSVLLLPCRHLCLCKYCEESTNLCPVCHSTKTTTVQVSGSPYSATDYSLGCEQTPLIYTQLGRNLMRVAIRRIEPTIPVLKSKGSTT
ncbi:zinc finger protein [Macleaya cordata]|uniref:Zinc finger protein n=1 Tax=Macleaya cordata TaxID=56857 RepID=A0A200RDE9_MACCD|nr:zinc finger protein [Macleaya cordata]